MTEDPAPRSLEITCARFQFGGAKQPFIDLADVCLEWTGMANLVAPSGYGKTTLLRLLSGWYDHKDPNVKLQANLSGAGDVRLIGAHAALLPWKTVRQNIRFLTGKEITENDMRARLADVALDPATLDLYPYELSLGMYKRVELIVALLQDPALLLLDEFFSSLDEETRARARLLIEKMRSGRLTLVTAHEKELRNWVGGKSFALHKNARTGTIDRIETV